MIKVTLSYPRVAELDFDYDYYVHKHSPYAIGEFKKFGMIRAELDLCERQVRAEVPDLYAVTTQYWQSTEDAENAFASEEVARVREDAHHYYAAPATVRFFTLIDPES
jgi:uncharacterized protein (TIGR02118 family)